MLDRGNAADISTHDDPLFLNIAHGGKLYRHHCGYGQSNRKKIQY